MLTCYLQGGLGNQLFQIFTTIAYALNHKKVFMFTNKHRLDAARSTYWTTFLAPLAKFTKDVNYNHSGLLKLVEKEFAYNELPYVNGDNILLCGYFQSEKYFAPHAHNIMKLINLADQKARVKLKTNLEQKYHFAYAQTISLHIRRGDYKKLPDHYPLLSYAYYQAALAHIVAASRVPVNTVLIFCEQPDVDDISPLLEQLKQKYPQLTFRFIEFNISDWEQLLLMSLCQHNIIANSSYSWWGAYFSSKLDKIVCYPANWFGTKLQQHNTKDLCPAHWVKIAG